MSPPASHVTLALLLFFFFFLNQFIFREDRPEVQTGRDTE